MKLSSFISSGTQFFRFAPGLILFPLAGLLINLVFGGRLRERAIGWVASLASGLSFVVAVLLALSLPGRPGGMTIPIADWITAGELHVQWAILVDTLSVTMMLVVSGVGTLIHIYAIGYMHEDVRHNGDPGRFRRFFVFFNLFIMMMMILVSADNYLMLFVGWEGVGLCSYLLIGFWYEKGKDGIGNALAGKKAFIVNRVGDFGFLIAAFLIFGLFRSFNFGQIFGMLPQVAQASPKILLFITLFMLLGVAGKSAQLPLYVWLPDAMAGPTPVSALIHAATMVTAGVYLVARSHPLYSLVPAAQNTVALVGGLTALFAATIAVAQFDIKKVLAYSTISQLGFMVAAVGMGAFTAGMFHLVTHAFFKALLFLSAGSVIQGVEYGLHVVEHNPRLKKTLKEDEHFDAQDMRHMGGLRQRMPLTFWVYLAGALALSGIFPLAGFWSKDEILAEALSRNPLVYWLLTVAAFFTAFYMGRQVLMVFFGKSRSEPAEYARENPPLMTVPLVILAILAVLGGLLNLPGVDTLSNWLNATLRAGHAAVEGGAFNPLVAIISTVLAVLGLLAAWLIYLRPEKIASQNPTGWDRKRLAMTAQTDLSLRGAPSATKQSRFPGAEIASQTDLSLRGALSATKQSQRNQSEIASQKTLAMTDKADPLSRLLGPLFTGMEHKWYVDEIYAFLFVRPYVNGARFLAETVDLRFWHDWFHERVLAGGYQALSSLLSQRIDLGFIDAIANGIGALAQWTARSLRRIQTGYVRNYALSIFLGVVLIIGFLILRR